MMNAIATLLGIGVLAWMFVFLDWIGRRRDRRKREGGA
jgi:hypothetical protein